MRKASRRAVEVAEEYADGEVSEETKAAVLRAAKDAASVPTRRGNGSIAADMAYRVLSGDAWDSVTAAVGSGLKREREVALARDVFGNPFRPITLAADFLRWGGGMVPKLARAIYDDRAFGQLPVLADALEDAGCTDPAILAHCRGPGPHVRGCWVLDLLLGKT
jgi:hypothetical protein